MECFNWTGLGNRNFDLGFLSKSKNSWLNLKSGVLGRSKKEGKAEPVQVVHWSWLRWGPI
jgi:hypothetical protein